MRTLIFGLGNPILTDDAVGLIVAREVHARVGGPDVDLVEASVAGMDVLDLVCGYDKVVVIDAVKTRGGRAGDLHLLGPEDLASTPRLAAPHDVDFGLALQLGRYLEKEMPGEVRIYAVEVADACTFGEGLTPEDPAVRPHARRCGQCPVDRPDYYRQRVCPAGGAAE
jgi:hydrogenase maturation protease